MPEIATEIAAKTKTDNYQNSNGCDQDGTS